MSATERLRPYHFKPGQSGNPLGRPKAPEYLRKIASLTQIEACKLISKYGRMTMAELTLAIESKTTPVIDLAIASIFNQSILTGDYKRLEFLLDRAIGKAPLIEESEEEVAAREELRNLTNPELLALIKNKIPELENKRA